MRWDEILILSLLGQSDMEILIPALIAIAAGLLIRPQPVPVPVKAKNGRR